MLINPRDKIAYAPEGSDGSSADDILDIFKMDFEGDVSTDTPVAPATPVEPQSEPAVPADAGTPVAPETETPPVVEPEPAPSAPAPKTGPSAEELLAQALEVNKQLTAKIAAQGPAEPSQPEIDEDTKVFAPKRPEDYTFNINPKLYEGLFSADASADERMQCLQAYASGIATTVHNNILQSLGSWTRENFQAVPSVVKMLIDRTQQATQSSEQIRETFYKKNPDLQKPELYPLIKATIQAVQKETKATVWSESLADSVANRVRSVLSGYAQASKPKAAAPIMTPAAAKPAPVLVDNDPNSSANIFATLNSEF